ncbi:hypothetical protein IJ818_06150, partial [bacterium]|nr:hypothetical protein [bacterium]
MKINSINNFMSAKPIQRLMFKGAVENPITPVSKVNLNQPDKDVFEKHSAKSDIQTENKPASKADIGNVKEVLTEKTENKFELPKDKEFKKPVLATKEKPYCQFDQEKVDLFVNAREKAIPALTEMLNNAKDEGEVCEGLYIANAMAAENVKGVDKMYYGTFSKFNEEKSPNVQSLLSGVYRRILVPDTFGPLVKML